MLDGDSQLVDIRGPRTKNRGEGGVNQLASFAEPRYPADRITDGEKSTNTALF